MNDGTGSKTDDRILAAQLPNANSIDRPSPEFTEKPIPGNASIAGAYNLVSEAEAEEVHFTKACGPENDTSVLDEPSSPIQRKRGKGKSDLRTKRVFIKMTPKEKTEAKQRANGKSLSGIARAFLLGLPLAKVKPGPKRKGPLSPFETERIRQLVAWNASLAHIARSANGQDSKDVLDALRQLDLEFKKAAQ